MKTRTLLWVILGLTLLAVVIDWPKVPVKFNIGSWKVDTVLAGPDLDLTKYGIPVQRELNVRQGLDLQGGTEVALNLDMSKIKAADRQSASDAAVSVLQNRVNYTGATEAVVQPARVGDDWRVLVELPGVKDTAQAVQLIGQTAQLEFREYADPSTATTQYPTMYNTISTGLTGKDLQRAVVDTTDTTKGPQVAITFTDEGKKKFAALTQRLVGQPLPVFLDDQLLTAPQVSTAITDGNGVISGSFTAQTARQLALQLSAGALPVPIQVVEQRTIGATLGQESINRSLVAGAIGLGLVMLFMLLNYRKLGLVADVALLLYALFTLALFKWIPVTLTLSGIAGFVLSIGMAVDANILIFERLKEELRRGNKMRAALEIGFNRAWPSIRDSNISTLITCAILYTFGSGSVRGFALTLALGVIVSLFTAVVVTRTFLRFLFASSASTNSSQIRKWASSPRSRRYATPHRANNGTVKEGA
jgi:preprotein translocase subunit SecD